MRRLLRRFRNAYVLSAFTRAIFAYLGYVLATSFLSERAGSGGFALLILWSNVLSIAATWLLSATRVGRFAGKVYLGLVWIAMLAAGLTFLRPGDTWVLPAFGVLVFALDVIGGNLLGYSIQAAAAPSVVRELNHACMSAEVAARLICAIFLTGMLRSGQWGLVLILALVCGAAHILAHRRVPAPPVVGAGGNRDLGRAFRYLFQDRLARAAFLALGWAQFAKFLVECLYFESAKTAFGTAANIGAFTSAASVATLALNLALQTTVGAWAIRVFPMSALLLLLPATVAIGAPLTLIFPTVWSALTLHVAFQIIHRSVQVPVARQGMYPAPVELQPALGPALSLMISTGVLALSWLTPHIRAWAGMQGLVMLLVVGTAVVMGTFVRMDGRYIRNLRRLHRQRTGGEWVESAGFVPPADSLPMSWAADHADEEEEELTKTTFHLGDLTQVREHYLSQLDWSEALSRHRAALQADDVRTRTAAAWLALFFGPSVQKQVLARHPRAEAWLARASWAQSMPLAGTDSSTRRKLKELVLLGREDEAQWNRVRQAFLHLADGEKRRLIDALADPELDAVRPVIWEVVDASAAQGRLCLEPALQPLWGLTFGESTAHRRLLDRFKSPPVGLGAEIERQLQFLRAQRFELQDFSLLRKRARERQIFLHCLFLEEWAGFPGKVGREIRQTIQDFSYLEEAERALLLDLHGHFLKKSPRAALWRPFLS